MELDHEAPASALDDAGAAAGLAVALELPAAPSLIERCAIGSRSVLEHVNAGRRHGRAAG